MEEDLKFLSKEDIWNSLFGDLFEYMLLVFI
jgi:hypothetical protein